MTERKLPKPSDLPQIDQNVKIDTLKDMKTSLRAFLDTVRTRESDDLLAIRLKIIHGGKAYYYATGVNVSLDDYYTIAGADHPGENKRRPCRGRLRTKQEIVHEKLKKANDILIEMNGFFPDRFKTEFKGERGDWDNVAFAFSQYIADLKERKSFNYAETFENAEKSFNGFSKGRKLLFSENITYKWLLRYEKWMTDDNGKSRDAVGVYTRNLKVLYNKAIRKRAVSRGDNPFDRNAYPRYTPPNSSNRKRAYHKDIMKRLFAYQRENEDFNLDMFLFAYMCNGQNPTDLFRLTFKNIEGDTIIYIRHKVRNKKEREEIIADYNPVMKEIVRRWGNPSGVGYIFPVLRPGMSEEQRVNAINNKKDSINKSLKRLFKKLKIDMNVSWQFARHTYATTIARSSKFSDTYLSKSMGHSSMQTTLRYKSLLPDEKTMEEARSALLDFD